MKQYAVIGASTFGKRVLEELIVLDCEIILIDKNPNVIESFKNDVTAAYIADVIDEKIVNKLIPADIDAAVVDLGDRIEPSILVTKYLSKLGVSNIIVKAESDQHGEILSIVGADHVVFPNFEAAKRIIPLLVSDLLFNYLPVSKNFVMAETSVPQELVGHTTLEMDVRKKQGISIVAFRKSGQDNYQFFTPEYCIQKEDVLLIAGKEDEVMNFSGKTIIERPWGGLLKQFFGR